MNMNKLAKIVTGIEAGKIEVSIAQVKEILAIVSDMASMDSDVVALLIRNGQRRRKKGEQFYSVDL